jgi:glycosyltransferase involved in cell wall biosynthesis/predicted O-methyltransferase YrrM
MIQSNADYVNTGYGVQAKHMVRMFRDIGITLAQAPFYGLEGSVIVKDGIPLYPRGANGYGDDITPAHAQHFGADAIVALLDSWVLNMQNYQGHRLMLYAPVDHDPMPAGIANKLREAWLPIMYSKFAVEQCEMQGIQTAYAPHAIDTERFQPMDRAQARQALGWPADRPILVTVGANKGYPSRKCWPEMFAAFAELRKVYPDTLWYCHTNISANGEMQGMNLNAIAEFYGVSGAVLFPSQYHLHIGYDDSYLQMVYAAGDLFYLPSGGEGFGVPLVESLACGTPLLTTELTAQRDIVNAGVPGFYLPQEACEPRMTPLWSTQFSPRIGELSTLLISAVDRLTRLSNAERWEKYGKPGRAFAEQYGIDVVRETYWRPIWQHVADRIYDEGRQRFAGHAQVQRDINASLQIANPADRYAHWLNRWSDIRAHLPTLYDAAVGTVVEIGARSGVSTAALIAGVEVHGGHVFSIDLDPGCAQLFDHPQWTFIHANSLDGATVSVALRRTLQTPDNQHSAIDTLFVDGEHTFPQVEAELALYGPHVRPGGQILLHDVVSYPEVRRAAELWAQQHGHTFTMREASNGLGCITIAEPAFDMMRSPVIAAPVEVQA